MRWLRTLPLWGKILVGVPLFWYPLSAVHECGHVVATWLSGGTVDAIVWHGYVFSETIRSNDQHPLLTCWAGPIAGTALPAFFAWMLRSTGIGWLLLWFAALCLIGNGLYIGLGTWMDGGDGGDLLRLGCPPFFLILFGVVAVSIGCVALVWTQRNT